MIDPTCQCADDAIDIFVLQHPKDSPSERVVSHLIQIGCKMGRRMRVVPNVKYNGRAPGQHLKTSR